MFEVESETGDQRGAFTRLNKAYLKKTAPLENSRGQPYSAIYNGSTVREQQPVQQPILR